MIKALWKQIEDRRNKVPPKPRKPIRARSARMTERMKEYRRIAKGFLAITFWCECCIDRMNGMVRPAKEIHHSKGRSGNLLMATRHFKAVCSPCHRWIHNNPDKARKIGMLAQRGEWGKYP